ncbi:MAG: hypothetical protein EHM35_06045 [Planctomycetaceae bacterium]|nr:MAG: hypothetical protein EHM35_06045 [Planctomycetaceae bacterium]
MRNGFPPVAAALTLLWATWAAGQARPSDMNVAIPGVSGVSGLLTNSLLEKGCFSCYSTVPTRMSQGAGVLRAAADEQLPLPGTMEYIEIDTLVVVYPRYQRDYSGGRLRVNLSAKDIETLKTETAEATHFFWRSSNCKCLVKTDWMVMDRVLTPSQLWDLSGKGEYWLTYWPVGGGSVEQDLRNAGVTNRQYSVVVVLYAFENSDGAVAAIGGGTYGVDIGFLGNTSYVAIPLAWGLDCDGVFVHEYLHSLDSIFTASGNPLGSDMGHADRPELFTYPADSGRHFNFLLSNVLNPRSWIALDPQWARVVIAPDGDGDGVPDSGALPATEESLGSSPTEKDTDGDGLEDLKELTAAYYRESDPRNPDTDADGLSDGADPYPLFWCNNQVPKSQPQIDGLIRTGEYVQVADLPAADSDLQVSAYTAWSDGMLYLAADVIDNRVQTPYEDPFWSFDDNLEVDIDGRRDGWLTGDQRNYRFCVVPVGSQGRPYVLGEFGSRETGTMEWRDIDVSTVVAGYTLHSSGYRIEMAIPAKVLNATSARTADVRIAANSSVRLTFSVCDNDAYGDWPEFNLFTARDSDTPAFVDLRFTQELSPGQ